VQSLVQLVIESNCKQDFFDDNPDEQAVDSGNAAPTACCSASVRCPATVSRSAAAVPSSIGSVWSAPSPTVIRLAAGRICPRALCRLLTVALRLNSGTLCASFRGSDGFRVSPLGLLERLKIANWISTGAGAQFGVARSRTSGVFGDPDSFLNFLYLSLDLLNILFAYVIV
jgi:hypothetical protein